MLGLLRHLDMLYAASISVQVRRVRHDGLVDMRFIVQRLERGPEDNLTFTD